MRARAIDELTANISKVSPINRIELGNKYYVPQWLTEAYADVFIRQDHLTTEEGKKLGLEITVKVLKGRDECKRNYWNSSGPHVTELVEKILPLPKPQKKKKKKAGRFVYT